MVALKSNTEWKQWGKEDPLFGVASWANKQKGGAEPWTEEEFYALGKSDWEDFWREWLQYGVDTNSCLEIGCGAGRITSQLGQAFGWVYAVDVSEDMVRCARRVVGSNVEFSIVDGIRLPQADRSVKAVFSTHVLQHLDDVETGYAYFREAFRVLDSGGTIMIHLPLYEMIPGKLNGLVRSVHSLSLKLTTTIADVQRWRGHKVMRSTPYPIRALYRELAEIGFTSIEFRTFPTKSNDDLHPFVFASR